MQAGQLEAAAVANAGGHGGSHQVGAIEAGRRRILGLFGEVIAWPGLHGVGGAGCVQPWLTCLGRLARAAGDRVTGEALGLQMELSEGPLDTTTQQRGQAWGQA